MLKDGLKVGGASSSGTIGCFVQFELPEGVMTDDEIKEISTNVVHESFLLLKRNMDVFSSVQLNGFKTLSDLVSNVLYERTISLSSEDPVAVSQTQQLLYDPHYHKLLDGITAECVKMKYAHELFREVYGPEPRNHEDVPGANDDVPGANDDVPGPNENAPGRIIRSNKSLCSLDYGPVSQNVPFGTLFMRGNARIFNSLPQLHLEVLDYCLLKDESMHRNENLVTFGVNFLVPREDMVSIAAPLKIRWCIVDCFALYLNELACFESSGPQRFFFGVRQSIYIPILLEDHYVLFVVDHAKELIYYLDNIIWRDSTLDYFRELSSRVCVQLDAFLGKRNHPKSTQLPSYKFEIVELEWRKNKINNMDCAVFVMYHMLHFVGESFILNELKTIAGRKFLCRQVCTTFVLCDMNESRADVLVELAKFNERKKNAEYVKAIEDRRKAAIAEKKKKEAEERKEAKEKAKAAEENAKAAEEKPKEKRAKKQTKKYTPSKE